MGPHEIVARGLEGSPHIIADPGNAGTIATRGRMIGYVPLKTTSGAETRTLPPPIHRGQILTLALETNSGSSVAVTLGTTSGRKVSGSTYNNSSMTALNSITISTVGGAAFLRGVNNNGTLMWYLESSMGCTFA